MRLIFYWMNLGLTFTYAIHYSKCFDHEHLYLSELVNRYFVFTKDGRMLFSSSSKHLLLVCCVVAYTFYFNFLVKWFSLLNWRLFYKPSTYKAAKRSPCIKTIVTPYLQYVPPVGGLWETASFPFASSEHHNARVCMVGAY